MPLKNVREIGSMGRYREYKECAYIKGKDIPVRGRGGP
jgi:hypothetical protein